MEYTSPGYTVARWGLQLWLVMALALQLEVTCQHHHDIRHNRHYSQHPYQGYLEPDYDDATVVPKPWFMDAPVNVSVHMGKMATLKCTVYNLGTKEVVWRRVMREDADNNILTLGELTWAQGGSYSVDHRVEDHQVTISHWDLLITNVRPDHEGTYECQITDVTPIRRHVYLKVLPPVVSTPAVVMTGGKYVDLNQRLHLMCNATGGDKIPDEIDWFKDGTKLTKPTGTRVLITKYILELKALISELIVEHAEMSDSGSYICRSSDKKIDSIKVTVLTAGTVNVKRGTGSHKSDNPDDDENGSGVILFPALHVMWLIGSLLSCRLLTSLS